MFVLCRRVLLTSGCRAVICAHNYQAFLGLSGVLWGPDEAQKLAEQALGGRVGDVSLSACLPQPIFFLQALHLLQVSQASSLLSPVGGPVWLGVAWTSRSWSGPHCTCQLLTDILFP